MFFPYILLVNALLTLKLNVSAIKLPQTANNNKDTPVIILSKLILIIIYIYIYISNNIILKILDKLFVK